MQRATACMKEKQFRSKAGFFGTLGAIGGLIWCLKQDCMLRYSMSRDLVEVVETIDVTSWHKPLGAGAADALEDGKVLFFPRLGFMLQESEQRFLSANHVDPKSKNISFDANTGDAKHALGTGADVASIVAMMRRYYERARSLVGAILPSYAEALTIGRTSFRPVEIRGRKTSPRKDDSRLHIDAFPSMPVGGRRILRVFSNVNPQQQDRLWRIGDDFANVARRFVGSIPAPFWGSAWIMGKLGVTKGLALLTITRCSRCMTQ